MELNYGKLGNYLDLETLNKTNLNEIISQEDLDIFNAHLAEVLKDKKGNPRKMPQGVFEKTVNGKKYYVMNEDGCFGFGYSLTSKTSILISSHNEQLIIEEFNTQTEKSLNLLYIENGQVKESRGDKFKMKENILEKTK